MEQIKHTDPIVVPYVVHRDAIAHDRWVIKRLIAALIIVIVLMVATNALWIYEWMQYDYVSEDMYIDSDGYGVASYVGGNGGVYYEQGLCPQEVENAG